MKKIKGLMGYIPSDVEMEDMEVIVEIDTGGTSSDGFKGEETIGIAETQYGNLCIFRGGKSDIYPLNTSTVIHISEDGKSIGQVLRDLADAYDGS